MRNTFPWFKVHSSMINEATYHDLSDGAFRAYILILCFQNEYGDDATGDTKADAKRIEWQARKPIAKYIEELTAAQLISTEPDTNNIFILDWCESNTRNRRPPKY